MGVARGLAEDRKSNVDMSLPQKRSISLTKSIFYVKCEIMVLSKRYHDL